MPAIRNKFICSFVTPKVTLQARNSGNMFAKNHYHPFKEVSNAMVTPEQKHPTKLYFENVRIFFHSYLQKNQEQTFRK